MRKERKTKWNPECDKAFQKLKQYLQQAPLLSTPQEGDVLLLYLAVFDHATISVLV